MRELLEKTVSKKTRVIAIDINHNHPEFYQYKTGKNTREKIRLLLDKISSAYEQAHALTPEAEILITWREYGLTDANNSKFINNHDKKNLLEEIKRLVNEKVMLSILIGPTLIQKKRERDSLPKLNKYYQNLSWISTLEPKNEPGFFGNMLIRQHLQANHDEIRQIKKTPFYTVKNSAYFVSKSEEKINVQPIAKKAPYNEINQYTTVTSGSDCPRKESNTVFQPGKGRGKDSFFKLPNDKSALLQICREHVLGVAVPRENMETVDVHFVLSASILPKLNNIRGKHAIFIDSNYAPLHLVKSPKDSSDDRVELSVLCLFDNSNQLVPVKPFCPLQFSLKPLLKKLPENGSNQQFINKLKKHLNATRLLEQDEYMNIINLIDHEFEKSDNSPERNIALYEMGIKVVDETRMRYGVKVMNNMLKEKQFPQCRKDLLTLVIVNAYLANENNDEGSDMSYLNIIFKYLNVSRSELNEIEWGDCSDFAHNAFNLIQF